MSAPSLRVCANNQASTCTTKKMDVWLQVLLMACLSMFKVVSMFLGVAKIRSRLAGHRFIAIVEVLTPHVAHRENRARLKARC